MENYNASYGSCADEGYAFVCPDSEPAIDDDAICGWSGSDYVFSKETETQFCISNPDCALDWCGGAEFLDWEKIASSTCMITDKYISEEECAQKAPLEAGIPWVWTERMDGYGSGYQCMVDGHFEQSACLYYGDNKQLPIQWYFSLTCSSLYSQFMGSLAERGETCGDSSLAYYFQGQGCCLHNPATTASPTASPVPYYLESVNDMTQETECFEINISPSCTAAITIVVQMVNRFSPGSCRSTDATYIDVTNMLTVNNYLPYEPLSDWSEGYGCEDFTKPMAEIPLSLFYKELPKPASGWFVKHMIYDSGDCTGSPGFTTYHTSDYFGFGACRDMSEFAGRTLYKKVECAAEDTIISQFYSDANCTVVAPNDEVFRTDINSHMQCKKMGEVAGTYSKMMFSGPCPAAVL